MSFLTRCLAPLSVALLLTPAALADPPVTIGLDDLAPGGTVTTTAPLAAGEIKWFSFSFTTTATSASLRWVDIDTAGSVLSNNDSMVGLYTAAGNLVSFDDDDGPGNLSALSFGSGSGLPGGGTGGNTSDGRDGTLPAGFYYIAVCAFNSTFGASNWAVTSASTATGTVSLTLRAGALTPPPPPPAIDIGVLNPGVPASINVNVTPSQQVAWVTFVLPNPISASLSSWFDADTGGTVIAGSDTEIGLYRAGGSLVSTDDDDGPGNLSALSFGAGSGLPGGGAGGATSNGRDGALGAGRYYMAVSCFNATFGPGFSVTSTHTNTGSIRLNLASSPPSTLLPITRAQAVALFMGSVAVHPEFGAAWCPNADWDFGAGYEGLLPAGTIIRPFVGAPRAPLPAPAYFFFVNDGVGATYSHPVRYVFIPALGGGGPVVSTPDDWWPLIQVPGRPPEEFFHQLEQNASGAPPGAANPQGFITGVAINPPDIQAGPVPGPGGTQLTSWGLIAIGDDRKDFKADGPRFEKDLKELEKVPDAKIKQANGGNPATKEQICKLFDDFAAANMFCDKVYIRISTHGVDPAKSPPGGITCMGGGVITPAELCAKIKKVAKLAGRVCLIINACFSENMLSADNWDLPSGSVILVSAAKDRVGYGWTYMDGTDTFTGSAFPYALSKCKRDPAADANHDGKVDDVEAFRWTLAQTPCYKLNATTMRYPCGRPPGVAETPENQDPKPSVRIVGATPKSTNINVPNATGGTKTDFHMIFRGDVRGGKARAWRSNSRDRIAGRWGPGQETVTYDRAKDETMVCYMDVNDPILPGQYVHFGYDRKEGGLDLIRMNWTPTPDPPAGPDKVPAKGTKTGKSPDGQSAGIEHLNRSIDVGGTGVPLMLDSFFDVFAEPIRLEDLNLDNPRFHQFPDPWPTLGSSTLAPDSAPSFSLSIPSQLSPSQYLVVRSELSWPLNPATATILEEFPPLGGDPCFSTTDTFEFYDEGSPCMPGPWTDFMGVADTCGVLNTEQAFSGTHSVKVIGSVGGTSGHGDNMIKTFDLTGGHWVVTAQTYVPSTSTGNAYFIVIDQYPDPLHYGAWAVLDGSAGNVRNVANSSEQVPLVRDQWVPLTLDIDIDLDKVTMIYNGVQVFTGESYQHTINFPGSAPAGLPHIAGIVLHGGEPGIDGTTGTYFDDVGLAGVCPPPCLADIVSVGGLPPPDGLATGDDFIAFINAFSSGDPLADIVSIGGLPPPDGLVTGDDFNAFIGAFASGCQ